MQAFEMAELTAQRAAEGKAYIEFLKVPDLSMGIYVLPAGGKDGQSPHTEDEVYYVVSGDARVRVGDEDQAVRAGSLIYVPKNVIHRFHSIVSELTLLVFFAPAEYSGRP